MSDIREDVELDPVILKHEAEAAWAVQQHWEKECLRYKEDLRVMRAQRQLEKPKVQAFDKISNLVAFRRAGWFEIGDPQTPDEILDKVSEAMVAAIQEVKRLAEAQIKEGPGVT